MDKYEGLTSGAALRFMQSEEHWISMEKKFPKTMAGRLEMIHSLIMPQPVLDCFGEPMLDEYDNQVFNEPIIKMTPEELLKILELT